MANEDKIKAAIQAGLDTVVAIADIENDEGCRRAVRSAGRSLVAKPPCAAFGCSARRRRRQRLADRYGAASIASTIQKIVGNDLQVG